ncbi:MAG: phosphatidate cytidylyltransferase [bacterium]|nr:phosphatidate cytidylyltransferase [bacterium]
MKRVLTAAVLAPTVFCIIFVGPPPLFLVVLALVAVLCFHEFRRLIEGHGLASSGPFGYVAGLVILLRPELLVVTLVALAAMVLALNARELGKVLPQAGAVLIGVVYVFGAWRCAIWLYNKDPHWVFYALVLNWLGDMAAYYTGRAFGRRKLAPRVSPKKTWEGSVGSVIASAIFGALYLPQFVEGTSVLVALGLTIVANAAGQVGDLAESAIKRGASVKDSGALLPGHGGMLDRVDSTLFTLPVVYLWVLKPWAG